VLIHIEVQVQEEDDFAEHMYVYNTLLLVKERALAMLHFAGPADLVAWLNRLSQQ
jgi:hypothetical protein